MAFTRARHEISFLLQEDGLLEHYIDMAVCQLLSLVSVVASGEIWLLACSKRIADPKVVVSGVVHVHSSAFNARPNTTGSLASSEHCSKII